MTKAYTKMATKISGGRNFIFTGQTKTSSWEIDVAKAGLRIHGVTLTDMDPTTPHEVATIGYGPLYVSLSEDIKAGDDLTSDGMGDFKKKGLTDDYAGVALTDGKRGGACVAFLYTDDAA